MAEELEQAIAALLNAQSILTSIHRDLVDAGSDKDLIMDSMAAVDQVIETLEGLSL